MATKSKHTKSNRVTKASRKKRTKSASTRQAPVPTIRRARRSSAQDKARTGFLNLPGEIRNSIYAMWQTSVPNHIHLATRGKQIFAASTLITSICRQIRDEFQDLATDDLFRTAHRIIVEVVDFDFSTIVKFADILSTTKRPGYEFEDFYGRDKETWDDADRILEVRLSVTTAFRQNPDVKKIIPFLRSHDGLLNLIPIQYKVREVADLTKSLELLESMALDGSFEQGRLWDEMAVLIKSWWSGQRGVQPPRDLYGRYEWLNAETDRFVGELLEDSDT